MATVLGGCHSQKSPGAPVIEFTRIPPAAQGWPGKNRCHLRPRQGCWSQSADRRLCQVGAVVGQPWPDKPFIAIQPDHTWSTPTHLGFEYAALLVDPGYEPPPTIDVTPTAGGSVAMVQTVKGVGPVQLAPTKLLSFSGYDWNVRTIAGDRRRTEQLVRRG